ncbi:PREDICTED: 26S proteasome non-ATPase regulatory subunit 5 isoform X2 [Rhagoletis zephyria]|uniref:26S proteasome non-ATPase regulatory subunit 5 isoform X2 n=1 Tax=Rhagoletis zephyria TaxID=28612 RepID=UPI0008114F05|nr:PREDICTED: 26S proteasome non-ATPase regulatory subunit 5 isoform X2 [Rhagoletis zephyria]
MSESWFCEQIENLRIQESRLSTLSEIRVRLSEIDGSRNEQLDVLVINRLLSAPEMYDCLEDGHESYQLVTDILSSCMSHLSINQSNLPSLLRRALTHPQPRIQALVFNTILKKLQRERRENPNSDIPAELVYHVLKGLRHERPEVGVPAIGILSIVLKSRIAEESVKGSLLDMLSSSETIKCRAYELAVNLAKQSPYMLQQSEFLLDRALSELDNDDVLFQVNILEILVPLAEQNHGLLYLEERRVFEIISRCVENPDQNPLDHLLIPANLTQSKKGKLLLDQIYPALIKEILEEITSYLKNLSTDLKNRAFSTLEIVFSTDGVNDKEIEEMLRKWFSYLSGAENMQFLMDFCRNPFPDIKVACLSFIKSVCLHRWGIVALKGTAGFVEYLLDRKIEFDKEAKYKKFELISLLANSDVFDIQIKLQLRTYVNEGPYFRQSIMDIATEGN